MFTAGTELGACVKVEVELEMGFAAGAELELEAGVASEAGGRAGAKVEAGADAACVSPLPVPPAWQSF